MNNAIDTKTPREHGYRMPAEWEPHKAIWFQWPGRTLGSEQGKPLHYEMNLEKTWLLMAWEIHTRVKVCILASDQTHRDHIQSTMSYFGFDMSQVDIYVTPIIDVWHRDTGPIFINDDNGNQAITSWNFNGWGSYPKHGEAEKHIPDFVAGITDLPVFAAPLVSEGGAIEVNGTGTFMATRSSIINDNRNPGMDQVAIEQSISNYLGVRNFVWLSGAPPEVCEMELGDGTDYHVDIAARFVNQNTVLYAWTDDTNDPRYPYLSKHREELGAATDENGMPLNLVPLKLPFGGVFAIGQRLDPILGSGSHFTDASYLNYLVTNDLVLVPAFGNAYDVDAQEILAEYFPDRDIVPIPVTSLTAEGGAIHCVTQQQPVP
jgi:agmatine deiminase